MNTDVLLPLYLTAGAYLIVSAALYLAPETTRSHIFFSVTVPSGFRGTVTAQSALRRYRRAVLFAAAATAVALALLALFGGIRFLPQAASPGMIVQATVAMTAWARARRQILPHSLPPPSIREASLSLRRTPLSFQWWAWTGPIALLLTAGAVLLALWDRLPARFPTHWTLHGHPDYWTAKTPFHVLAPIAIAIALCAFISAVAYWIERFSRRPAASAGMATSERKRRSLVYSILLGEEYLLAVNLGLTALAPLMSSGVATVLIRAVPFIAMGGTGAILIGCALISRRRARDPEAAPTDLTPDACWKWGIIYVNPDDSALIVERRMGIGYTLNFAHSATWAILAGLLILPVWIKMLLRH